MGLTLSGLPTRTQVKCNYTAGSFSKPGGAQSGRPLKEVSGSDTTEDAPDSATTGSKKMEGTKIEFGDLFYSWSFGDDQANGTHTFIVNNKAGQRTTINATVTVKCKKITTKITRTDTARRTAGKPGKPATETTPEVPATPPGPWIWTPGNEHESKSTETVNAIPSSRNYSVTVTMQPPEFRWGNGVAIGQTIQDSDALTADKWNELVDRTGQWYNWKHQSSGRTYNAKVNSNATIEADIYNVIASALSVPQVSGGPKGTIITAKAFTDLEDAVNK